MGDFKDIKSKQSKQRVREKEVAQIAATSFSIVINIAFIFKFVCCFKIAMAVTACNCFEKCATIYQRKVNAIRGNI